MDMCELAEAVRMHNLKGNAMYVYQVVDKDEKLIKINGIVQEYHALLYAEVARDSAEKLFPDLKPIQIKRVLK